MDSSFVESPNMMKYFIFLEKVWKKGLSWLGSSDFH